jgi:glycosyltransferase involved in cell wall biosynthesis
VKLLLVAHGWPPELVGGTENATRALAHALVRAGHTVVGVAGTLQRAAAGTVAADEKRDDGPGGTSLRLVRIRRGDLYFDHWQKSRSPGVARVFQELVRAERPDVVHVHHWIRLTRDLVACAARAGAPAVVTLHDHWVGCPIAFRVRPDTRAACDAPVGPHPCAACAGKTVPRTPWVPVGAAFLAVAERQRDLARELELARAIVVPTRAHAHALQRFLGSGGGPLAERTHVLPPVLEDWAAAEPSAPPPAPDAPLVLAAWGLLARHKGSDLLLAALARTRTPARFELHLMGAAESPAFQAELAAAATGLAVRFHGPYSTGAAGTLASTPASRAHAFVSATRAPESFGLVLDEARRLALPAVLPRFPAFEERAAQGGGVLFFEPGDAASLAGALERLRGELARLTAEARAARALVPVADEVARRHLELYARVAAQGAPAVAAPAWYEERIAAEALAQWDQAVSRTSAAELGL